MLCLLYTISSSNINKMQQKFYHLAASIPPFSSTAMDTQ